MRIKRLSRVMPALFTTISGAAVRLANNASTEASLPTSSTAPRLPADSDNCMTFHAGTALTDGQLTVTGGRVLCVTALGDTVRAAQKLAYQAVDQVAFPGMQYRRDIGHRALKKQD